MIAKCKKSDPLEWTHEGELYEVQQIGDKWIIADGLVISNEAFNECFELVTEGGEL